MASSPPLPFPASIPPQVAKTDLDEPEFNPAVHFQIEAPQSYYSYPIYKKEVLPWPPTEKLGAGAVAATAPFRVLSDEGLAYLRKLILNERKYSHGDERLPEALRGLAMRSKWANDMLTHPILDAVITQFTGEPVEPHTMMMNRGHINFGVVGSGKVVDQWHFDSVTYVLVLMVGDAPEEGGDLQCLMAKKEESKQIITDTNNNPAEDMLLNLKFPAGYGVFLYGSQILHHVTPVVKASMDRVTLVNSYNAINPWVPDTTVFRTFMTSSESAMAPWDYSRHRAWRIAKQLLSYCTETEYTSDREKLLAPLKQSLQELELTIQLVEGVVEEPQMYIKEDLLTQERQ